jgi:predicted TIM-barrel fold metal-dependent hydrolase
MIMTTELPFRFFDCDNHYYEALDAFTRHLEPAYRKRAMQWAQIDGKTRLLVGGKVNKFIPNPTFNPVAAPGVMDEYFRGRNPKGADPGKLFGELEPIRPEYRDRDARIALMDAQGMEGCILLPTLGVGMEQALTGDLPALTAAFRAFNRWLAEDWGFAYRNRIFAAPYITLADPGNAVRELEWALERDARFIVMVGGPVTTAAGMRAPADAMFDPFWRLANDAGITICYHGGESAYTRYLADWGENDFTEAFRANAFRGLASADALQDTIASHLASGLFHRFANLRIASIEVGSAWVFHLFEKLTKTFGQVPHLFPGGPPGDVPAARLGIAVLRGRAGQPATADRRRPHLDGLGLPARGGPDRAGVVHQGPAELQLHAGAVPDGHAGQRPVPRHPPSRLTRR